MHLQSILKWTSLTLILILVLLVFSGFVIDHSVRAAMDHRSVASGALQIIDDTGKPVRECPLKHTAVKAEISGFLSRVTVTQDFENPLAEKIEAVYTFPLSQTAAVDDLTMLIGDRVVKGKIMRREEAEAAYAAAKQLGKIAGLLDQERPNIFTQQVANILPGQQIRIVISYVETLKYEDGSYEWSFPMVVAPRYTPSNVEPQEPIAGADQQAGSLADVSRISPADARAETRAGHDISLEIDLNAGVPIVGIHSKTHETDVRQINDTRVVVQLKERVTIPNKDFVLTYRVAGDTINDAVLAHRSDRGGFFTLILQPPQRVSAADVMPKELVFVLDTSGSMSGFPLEQARWTMELALDNLYPHDTFNLITFSGDTRILFSEPVSATPENLEKARRFLARSKSDGGTEMMKAIKASLKPSDSQHHLRIVCFMTDGQVGNDAEIIAEVRKYRNARVFAMGFGSSPNRFLLEKMAEYGRGEVDYVLETGDAPAIANRFNQRVRSPLLTDLSVDWSNLPVSDVYPKRIPDLFSVKPLILSGRYASASKGIIRLKGKLAGADFVREIPLALPANQHEHDVLATLWARRKIDELMRDQLESLYDQEFQNQKREEITELGLKFKLMTQYTSFIAIDEVVFTGTEEPQRIDVPVEALPGSIAWGVAEYVTVTAGTSAASCCAQLLTHSISTRSIQDLPLQGRSFSGFVHLTSGGSGFYSSTMAQASQLTASRSGQASNFFVDGMSADFGITAGGESPGQSASGNTAALTASGGGNGLVALSEVQEIRIRISAPSPQDGLDDAQISVRTKAGTNEFHGSAFHYFGNDWLDANDWFANALGLEKPPKRLNMFGSTLGGPVQRDKTFFFGSYEGMRLRQPLVGVTDVPSLDARRMAPAGVRAFFEAFPVSTDPARIDGFSQFASGFANPARHDAASFRIDHALNSKIMLFGRYNLAGSEASLRGARGFSLNTINRLRSRAQTLTGSFVHTITPTMVVNLRANYSRLRVNGAYSLDEFGSALLAPGLFPSTSEIGQTGFDLNARNAALLVGDDVSNVQRQFNIAGTNTMSLGRHLLNFGGDYRRMSPIIAMRSSEHNVLFDGVARASAGVAARVNRINHIGPQTPVFETLSLFAHDEWKQSGHFTLSYGVRWDLAPAPSGHKALAVDQVNDPASLKLARPGTALWKTSLGNFAPSGGFAYLLSDPNDGSEFLVRGGIGIVYHVDQDRSGDVFANSIPFISGSAVFNSPFPLGLHAEEISSFIAFDPSLRVPYSLGWNLSIQRSLGRAQSVSAAYIGSAGKRLMHTQTVLDQSPDFTFLRIKTNRGLSNYRALQITFDRPLAKGLAARVFYTLSQSRDNVIDDLEREAMVASLDPNLDRGPSDFDMRHQLTAQVSYTLRAPVFRGVGNRILRNWTIDSIFYGRSAKPVSVYYAFPTAIGRASLRPNLVDEANPYVFDPAVAAGRRLNAAAFSGPSNLEQGTLGRNSLRGFSLYQIDLALRRKFNFTDTYGLQIQADAFNVFNHANFEDPIGNELVVGSTFNRGITLRPTLAFGQSTSLRGRNLAGGGFGSFYSFGGPRTLRFSVKLVF